MASASEQRSWLMLGRLTGESDISGTTLLNLDLVRRVVITSMTEIQLFFSETQIEVIQGTGALEVMKLLLERSVTRTGIPITFPATSDEPSSASPSNPPLEAKQ